MSHESTPPPEDTLLTVPECMALTRHGSAPAFYRWAEKNKGIRSRPGFYSRAAVLEAMKPKCPIPWQQSAGAIFNRRNAR